MGHNGKKRVKIIMLKRSMAAGLVAITLLFGCVSSELQSADDIIVSEPRETKNDRDVPLTVDELLEIRLISQKLYKLSGQTGKPHTLTGQHKMSGYLFFEGSRKDSGVFGRNYLTVDFDARHFSFEAHGFREFDISDEQAPVLLTGDVVNGGHLSGVGTIGLGRKEMNFTYVGELEFGGSKIKVNLPALGWILADDGTHYLYFMAEGKAAGHSISGGGFATLDR